jgi:protein involved in polysaccharide export with SLBB domain
MLRGHTKVPREPPLYSSSLSLSQTALGQEAGGAGASTVLPAEVVGANDLIEIMVPYCAELSRSFRVDSDGNLTLPLLKRSIKVAGLRPPQIAKQIEEALTAREGYERPDCDCFGD